MSTGNRRAQTKLSRQVRLRRTLHGLATLVGVTGLAIALLAPSGSTTPTAAAARLQGRRHASVSPLGRVPPGPPTDQRRLSIIKTISGHISPKSVVASDTGLVFAQNMMYTHTDTVYNSAGSLVKTIPDTVSMARFGIPGHPGVTHGAPVEAAFSPDSKFVYVSNYSMYGSGFGPEGIDSCTLARAKAAGDTNSFVYRIDTATLSIDQVIEVGLVPKFLAVTPNGKYLLVANWCSFDLSVVNIAEAKEVARLPMGAYPRGLAISPDSSTAYVAIMGADDVVKVNLSTLTKDGRFTVGDNPRHLVIDRTGRYLYASLNAPGDVVKVNLANDSAVATVHTGDECRSLAISADGRSLYVVNYGSDTVTKLRASNLQVLQHLDTGVHPIGITYDAVTGNVWVAVYSGQILVLADR